MTDLALIREAAEAPAATPLVARLQAMLREVLALLPAEGGDADGAVPTCAVDPETVTLAVDRFHGATFYLFQSRPVTGYEEQFRVGIEEALKAARERSA